MPQFKIFTNAARADVFINPALVRSVARYGPDSTQIFFDHEHKVVVMAQPEDVINELMEPSDPI